MADVKLIETDTYKESLNKFDKSIRPAIEKKVLKLKENPELGKPLLYSKLRELLIGNKYRVIYALSNSKDVDLLYVIPFGAFHKKELNNKYQKVLPEFEKELETLKKGLDKL